MITLSFILSFIVVFNYYIIRQINIKEDIDSDKKNNWVLLVLLLPLLGGIIYLFQIRNNKL